jgi:hypothetical protein
LQIAVPSFSVNAFPVSRCPGYPATLRLLRRIAGRKAFLRRFVDSLVVASRPAWISLLVRLAGLAIGVTTIARRLFSLDVVIATPPTPCAIGVVGFIHESFHLAITP